MSKLNEIITKAKEKDEKAIEELLLKFKPLLKSRAKRYSKIGLEYDDVFQQAALIFIIAIYDYQENRNIPFAGYIKKRINWGLYLYNRRYLAQKREISSGLNPKETNQ